MMEELIAHPGYLLLKSFADAQCLQRKNNILLTPTEQPLAQEFMKGEVQGIELIFKVPGTIIESSKAMISSDVGKDAEETD